MTLFPLLWNKQDEPYKQQDVSAKTKDIQNILLPANILLHCNPHVSVSLIRFYSDVTYASCVGTCHRMSMVRRVISVVSLNQVSWCLTQVFGWLVSLIGSPEVHRGRSLQRRTLSLHISLFAYYKFRQHVYDDLRRQ